jgi:AmmeMemoRadiSam system protein B
MVSARLPSRSRAATDDGKRGANGAWARPGGGHRRPALDASSHESTLEGVTSSASHRPAAVAGLFYPEDRAALRAELRAHLAAARPVPADALPPKLIVVPHAGTVYSGAIAAQAYAWLARWPGRWRRVVLLAPAHRVFVEGLAAPSVAAFDTPLGAVPVDREALRGVAGIGGPGRSPDLGGPGAGAVVVDDHVHAREHAIEVQLPFLQTVLGEFTLVPFAVGDATPDAVAEVIERLWGGDETLVVISTDLSHYLPYARARVVDAATIERVLALDGTLAHDQACGATPLNAALAVAARHRLRPRLLDLRNSGDTAGDRARVVGYAALVFT